jgi:transcriptional regulator with XRE-family HTH domain
MARRVRDEEILAQEDVFAQNYAAGDNHFDAAEKAGYDKYRGSELLKRPAVIKRIMELQRPYTVSWKRLLVKSMHALDQNLADANDYARELLFELRKGEKLTQKQVACFLGMLEVKASDRNTAARLVTDIMSKINPKSLNDAASAEDENMSRDAAIREMMGEDAGGPVADNSAPEEADSEGSGISPEDDEITH